MRFSPLGYFFAGAAAIVGTAYALRSTSVGKIYSMHLLTGLQQI